MRNFQTEVPLWKCIKLLPSTLEFKTATIIGYIGFVFEEPSRGNHIMIIERSSFSKNPPFSDFFLSTQKTQKVGFFKYKLLQFGNSLLRSVAWHPKKRLRKGLVWGAFSRKAPLTWRINVVGRPERKSKATFSNSADRVRWCHSCATLRETRTQLSFSFSLILGMRLGPEGDQPYL